MASSWAADACSARPSLGDRSGVGRLDLACDELGSQDPQPLVMSGQRVKGAAVLAERLAQLADGGEEDVEGVNARRQPVATGLVGQLGGDPVGDGASGLGATPVLVMARPGGRQPTLGRDARPDPT